MPIPPDATLEPSLHPRDHLLVRVGAERFAIPLAAVEEAVEEPEVVELPGAPSRCPGVLRWRGRRMPVHDASPVFGIDASRPPRVALVIAAGEPVAVVVDELLDVVAIAPGLIRAWVCRDDPHRVISGVAMIDGALVAIVRPESVAVACGGPDARVAVARVEAA